MSAHPGWQIVPYEGTNTYKRVRVRDDSRVRDVMRHIQAHDCVALIGPPFSEKTALLRDVAAGLTAAGRFRPLYLDLWQANSEDEAAFFTSLASLIENSRARLEQASPSAASIPSATGRDLASGRNQAQVVQAPAAAPLVPSAHAFQNYLGEFTDAQAGHLVLLIDHLQALPHDLVHGLLLALRAAYMERSIDAPRQLMTVVAGSMNLVGLSASPVSPFNVARPVIATPLTEDQTLALAEATLKANGCIASNAALRRIVDWASGDHYLVPRLCGWAANLVQGYRRTLVDRRVVDRAAQRLLADERSLAPVHEAVRMIEEDPDTILDVLYLLQHDSLARSRAHQMPTRTGADRLQLSGAVVLADGCYALKNQTYREALSDHFTTERVGHILRISGRWQEAIAYLAPQISADPSQTLAGPRPLGPLSAAPRGAADRLAERQQHIRTAAQAQLLEATVQSMYAGYAGDSLARACELLAGGLQQGFGLSDVAVYRAIPAQARLELVYPEHSAPAVISLSDADSVEARAFTYGNYALRGSASEARLVVALSAGARRLGVVTIERYMRGRGPHELPEQLPDLLHFLSHAAQAMAEVMVRAAYREIGQAVLDAGTLQPTMHRVLEVVSEALGCDVANLYLLLGDEGADAGKDAVLAMEAGVGQPWSPEWQALARFRMSSDHPAVGCLRSGRQLLTTGRDERLDRNLISRFRLDRYTWVYLPLQAAGRPLGTLELGYSEALRYVPGQESRADLAAFADQVAIAVHNMQLLRRTDEALARRVTELEKLRGSSLAISSTLDVPTVLARIIRDVRALFPGSETTVWEYDEERELLCVLQSSLTDPDYLTQRASAGSISQRAAVTRRVQVVPDLAALPDAQQDPAVRMGLRSLIAVPLISHDHVLGTINLYSGAEAPALGPGAAELLQAFAAHAAVAIENARLHEEELQRQRLEQELTVAQTIQRSMLPTANPQLVGWQFAAVYRSARVVGGDFYDYCELPGEQQRLGILAADVTDKGIPAALFMALSRTIIRAMALSGRGPAAVLTRSNELILKDSRSDLALTAVYAILEPASGRVIYANGGHNRPVWLHARSGRVEELAARGIILGAFDDIELEERRVDLEPGDVLVFYTDGITDALDPEGDAFGEERLFATLAGSGAGSADEVLNAIVSAVDSFAAGAEQADDITCVVVKRLP